MVSVFLTAMATLRRKNGPKQETAQVLKTTHALLQHNNYPIRQAEVHWCKLCTERRLHLLCQSIVQLFCFNCAAPSPAAL